VSVVQALWYIYGKSKKKRKLCLPPPGFGLYEFFLKRSVKTETIFEDFESPKILTNFLGFLPWPLK
jgi:hypothetical protein